MISLDVCLHPQPAVPAETGTVQLARIDYRTILPNDADRRRTFDISFEEAAERLHELKRLFFEPDGSFVWVGDGWQLDGQVFDHDGRAAYVELKGTAPADALERLLSAFGWPQQQFIYQIKRSGVFVDESEFRRLARGCECERVRE